MAIDEDFPANHEFHEWVHLGCFLKKPTAWDLGAPEVAAICTPHTKIVLEMSDPPGCWMNKLRFWCDSTVIPSHTISGSKLFHRYVCQTGSTWLTLLFSWQCPVLIYGNEYWPRTNFSSNLAQNHLNTHLQSLKFQKESKKKSKKTPKFSDKQMSNTPFFGSGTPSFPQKIPKSSDPRERQIRACRRKATSAKLAPLERKLMAAPGIHGIGWFMDDLWMIHGWFMDDSCWFSEGLYNHKSWIIHKSAINHDDITIVNGIFIRFSG